ncbi:MAG TPA: MmgE/PrpD family protein [Streptosporangiales bacterium]
MTQTQAGIADTAEQTGATQTLGSFVARLRFDALPAEVVAKTKLLIRDGIGNQLAASVIAEPARVAHELVAEFGGAEQATVTGYGTRLPVPFAAMVNAMLGHGVELDDAHGQALTKSGSLLIPSVLTTGEFRHRSGADTITAAAAGYDVMVRLGLAVNPGNRKRGFHTTGTVGAIASSAAAAKQLGLDEDQVTDALGLGAMQSAGIQAYLDFPCMAKPLSPGKAAFNGTLAAMLASKGFTGPRRGLESREGFFSAYTDGVDLDQIHSGLGTSFKVMEVGFKPHAACRYAHGPIDAAQAIRAEHGLRPDQVAGVRVRMGELAVRQSGRTEVPNLNSAMGSTPFGVALALLHGLNGLGDYTKGFADQDVHRVARDVELVPEPSYGLMGRQAVVEVILPDGTTLTHAVDGPRGEPDNPLSETELENKFLGLASMRVGDAAAREISDMVMRLEEVGDVSDLVALLAKG